jgi:hypothetical protein
VTPLFHAWQAKGLLFQILRIPNFKAGIPKTYVTCRPRVKGCNWKLQWDCAGKCFRA